MKLFLKRLLSFLFVLIILLVIKYISIEPEIANKIYYAKYIDYLSQTETKDYNTLIFGSSRIYRHVNPEYFDSLNIELNISSYNLGAPATFNPELYYLYDRFLDDYEKGLINDNIKFTFIELQRINNLTIDNALSEQGSYWNNLENLSYSVSYINEFDRRNKFKMKLLINYFISFFTNVSSIYNQSVYLSEKTDLMNNGYISLEQEVDELHSLDLNERRENFKTNPEELFLRTTYVTNQSIEELKEGLIIKSLETKLKGLINRSNNLGIKTYLIIPPRQEKDTYKDVLPLLDILKDNIISLVSITDHPELYDLNNSFDVGHLNDNGTKFFTKYLSDNFKKLY